MTEILRQKLIKLVRGEDGVALVVTLALFMFLYISCAGVYAIGRSVKERVILQNAVDAAAYSAAVIQADYLSRIATINKAMSWNYVQFLKSQKSWIVLRFLNKVHDEMWNFNTPVLVIAGGTETAFSSKGELAAYINSKPSLEAFEADINLYYGQLLLQQASLSALREEMVGKGLEVGEVERTAEKVLRANLPFRLGELCWYAMHFEDVLTTMSSEDDERRFVSVSDDHILGDPLWFEFSDANGLGRDIRKMLKLYAPTWKRSHDNMHWSPSPLVDAYGDIARSVPLYQALVSPLKLIDFGYFPGEFPVGEDKSKGSITVVVAKRNENPWTGLVTDLTGFHAAFTHAEDNDWTFATATAQAGYHLDEGSPIYEAREYSLVGGGDFNEENLLVTDWDAVYLPLRKAFKNAAGLAAWITQDANWKKLVNDRKYIAGNLEDLRFDKLNSKALPRMHSNSGSEHVMQWDDSAFFDLIYH